MLLNTETECPLQYSGILEFLQCCTAAYAPVLTHPQDLPEGSSDFGGIPRVAGARRRRLRGAAAAGTSAVVVALFVAAGAAFGAVDFAAADLAGAFAAAVVVLRARGAGLAGVAAAAVFATSAVAALAAAGFAAALRAGLAAVTVSSGAAALAGAGFAGVAVLAGAALVVAGFAAAFFATAGFAVLGFGAAAALGSETGEAFTTAFGFAAGVGATLAAETGVLVCFASAGLTGALRGAAAFGSAGVGTARSAGRDVVPFRVTLSSRTPRADTSATSQPGISFAIWNPSSIWASAVRNQRSTPFFQ